jgi:tetratricopeptide (TPR) repeat protein
VHVPGWDEATKKLQEEGKVQVAGVIEEQHPDRARLFMQWKQMRWPVLVDSLNLLGVSAVPITIAIDEYGVIRLVNPKREEIELKFLNRTFEKPADLPTVKDIAPDLHSLEQATHQATSEAWQTYANALVEWAGPERLGEAIEAYQQALRLEPGSGPLHFRLGVAYLKRYDSDFRQPGDFQRAVEKWTAALEIDPNQYIWRRRIQQYGPRLDKPYPFYDWVETARKEIAARGETPVPLAVEPGGAEIAHPFDFAQGGPEKTFAAEQAGVNEPDPQGRILRDDGQFIKVEAAIVPDTKAEDVSARVHVVFRPNPALKAHWNNEAGSMVFWVSLPSGWNADQRLITLPNPPQPVSIETREVEFEVKGPKQNGAGPVMLPAYAVYYVCEDVNGVCMYRRQDVPITISPQELK